MDSSSHHNSVESQTRSLHPRRALLTALGSLAILGALWSGVWRCPSAVLFHFPCPACGSTRAMRSLLTGNFHGVLLNPVAPLVSLVFGFLIVRAVWLELSDGDLRRLGEGAGKLAVRVLLICSVLQIVLWSLRWFGLFGGPVPV